MSKKNKPTAEIVETVADEVLETATEVAEQAGKNDENFAKKSSEIPACESENPLDSLNKTADEQPKMAQKAEKAKSGGKAIGVIALLVALAVGGAGHFMTNKKFAQVDAQLNLLNEKIIQAQPLQTQLETPSFEAEKIQLAHLSDEYQKAVARVEQLERQQNAYTQQINALQSQVQKLGAMPVSEPTAWLLSDADFLLNNALRKMVLDYDIDTAKSLLIEADNVLAQVSEPKVLAVRDALKNDLNQLTRLNQVDQNSLMQRLAQLANMLDDMPLVETNNGLETESNEVSDSLDDWQKNIEKSADSFLSHFIRINDKASVKNDKVFIAPNQEIYLRENIRLRLQIAMMTIPRQQNELYKQSLDAVSSWVRSYFDGENHNVKRFLTEIDDLMEQSIYIDAPSRLQSLILLEQMLNKASKPIAKVQIEEEKALEPVQDMAQPSEQPAQPVQQ